MRPDTSCNRIHPRLHRSHRPRRIGNHKTQGTRTQTHQKEIGSIHRRRIEQGCRHRTASGPRRIRPIPQGNQASGTDTGSRHQPGIDGVCRRSCRIRGDTGSATNLAQPHPRRKRITANDRGQRTQRSTVIVVSAGIRDLTRRRGPRCLLHLVFQDRLRNIKTNRGVIGREPD